MQGALFKKYFDNHLSALRQTCSMQRNHVVATWLRDMLCVLKHLPARRSSHCRKLLALPHKTLRYPSHNVGDTGVLRLLTATALTQGKGQQVLLKCVQRCDVALAGLPSKT